MQRLSLKSKGWFEFLPGLAVLLALAGTFTLLDPFEPQVSPYFVVRFAYWCVLLVSIAVCARLTQWAAGRYLPQLDLGWRLVAEGLGFTMLFPPWAWIVSGVFSGELLSAADFLIIAGNVLALTAISALLTYIFAQRSAPPALSRARLYDRLPPDATADVVRLTVNDHYVAVYLEDGTDHRLLMRLADAVAEMEGVPGFLTHRSHWVSQVHISGRTRVDNRDYLLLVGDARVPISKTYLKNVVAADFV